MSFDRIVIGAGLAGIAAAAEFAKSGKSVLVLEARKRTGGRLYTDRTSGSAPYELGCSWFHEANTNPFVQLAEESGIPAEFDNAKTKLYGYDGELAADLDAGSLMGQFDKFVSHKLSISQNDESLKQLIGEFVNDTKGNLSEAQRKVLPGILKTPQLGKGLDSALLSGKSLISPDNGGDKMVIDGYDKVLEKIAEPLKESDIKLISPVKKVIVKDDKVEVVCADNASYSGKKVVVAVPLAILKANDIEFSPELPKELSSALEKSSVSAVGKVYFEFDHVFWDEDVDKIVVTADGTADAKSVRSEPALVTNWFKFNGKKKYPGVGILVGNAIIKGIEKNPDTAYNVLKPVLEAINISGKPVPEPTKWTATNWSVDPYSKGSYSTYEVGESLLENCKIFSRIYWDKLAFAGEHTVVSGATFAHGAYLSGLRAANAL